MDGFHIPLGIFHRIAEDFGINGRILLQAQRIHHILDALHAAAAEQTHQIVLQTQIESALAGIALTAGTATELIVDSPGLVALGANDEQTAGILHLLGLLGDFCLKAGDQFLIFAANIQNFRIVGFRIGIGLRQQLIFIALLAQLLHGQKFRITAQHNVRATAGHVGGNGNGAQLTGLGDDLGLLLMVLGVKHMVGHARFFQQLGENFAALDGNGAHQYRLALGVTGLHLVHNGPELACLVFIHHIGMVLTGHRAVCGDLHHIQLIDRTKFLFLRQRRAGHAGELAVQAEEILEGDGGQGLAFAGNGHAFLGLDGLVQALVVAAAIHQSAGEFIDDDDLAVLDHIVDVFFHQATGLHGLVDMVHQSGIFAVAQIFHTKVFFCLGHAAGCQGHGVGLLVHIVVRIQLIVAFLSLGLGKDLLAQGRNKIIRHLIQLGAFLALAGDNQRGTGLVDEDGVHFVHDGKIMSPLHQLLLVNGHVIPQIVKAQLVVGAVGNVSSIGCPALIRAHAGNHQAHSQAHIAVDLAHPFGVTLGQIIVDRNHMDALAGERIEIAGQNGD